MRTAGDIFCEKSYHVNYFYFSIFTAVYYPPKSNFRQLVIHKNNKNSVLKTRSCFFCFISLRKQFANYGQDILAWPINALLFPDLALFSQQDNPPEYIHCPKKLKLF